MTQASIFAAVETARARMRPGVVAALGGAGLVLIAQVPAPAQQRAGFERCVDVEIGRVKTFDCLNEELRRQVDRLQPTPAAPPFDARSQDVRIGIVNNTAVMQQYGKNFGRSVVPYRPPPPVYALPGAR